MIASLKSEFASDLNTNLLKIALNMREDSVAGLIVARFPVLLEEPTLRFAVEQKCLVFIKYVIFLT